MPKWKRSTARKPSKRDKDKRRHEEIELRLNESAMVSGGGEERGGRERERGGKRDAEIDRKRQAGRVE